MVNPITMAEAARASRELVERLDRQQEAATAASRNTTTTPQR